MIKQAIEKAGENATREDVRNAVAGMTYAARASSVCLTTHASCADRTSRSADVEDRSFAVVISLVFYADFSAYLYPFFGLVLFCVFPFAHET